MITSIYVDFDNSLVETNKSIIKLLKSNKEENDDLDYDYKNIDSTLTVEKKLQLFESSEFFENLQFKSGALEFLKKYEQKIIIISKGTEKNLELKERWIKENISPNIRFMGVINKSKVHMKGCLQIDDMMRELKTNAKIKVLYKDGHNFKWQKGYENTNILVANTWKEIDEIVEFYSKYDSYSLKRSKKK